MLKIDSLRVVGFKSFLERTDMSFDGGITAVVGPNGCGKSNIGDAIHWVLGEQSARTLRGEKMEDVIFAGSDARKPVGMAEVTLRLSGAAGLLPDDRDAVEISRRLYRSGESGYLIDGQRARLRDIQELLSRAHVGARTYAVIEQGKVDAILTARPKERRLLIEEAAGVIGYKQKRRLAELKLEATEANLLRVNDIVSEIQKQIGSLKRQAARARRYQRLQDEIRALQRKLFVHQARSLDGRLDEAKRNRAAASDLEAAESAEVARLEAEVEAARNDLAAMEGETSSRREELHRIDLGIDRETHGRTSLQERAAELGEEAVRLEADSESLEERLRALSEEIEAAGGQIEEIAGAISEAAARRESLEASHEERVARAAGLQQGLERSRREAMLARERLIEARNEKRRLEEERERAEARAARLAEQLESAGGDAAAREATLATERRKFDEVRSALGALREKIERQEGARKTTAQRLAESMRSAELTRGNVAAASERLRTLSDAVTRFAGRNEGVGYILSHGGAEGIRARGVVADFLRAGSEVERAAEGFLADLLPAVLVEETEDVVKAVSALRREGAGRCQFLAERNGHRDNGRRRAIPKELGREPGVLGTLSERLHAVAPYNGLITGRFEDAVVVESLERALDLHRRYPDQNFVTREGDVVRTNGLVAGGRSTRADEGLLAQTRAIEEARQELKQAERKTAGAEAVVTEARRLVEQAEGAFTQLTAERTELEKSLLTLKISRERLEEESLRLRRGEEVIGAERKQLVAEIEEIDGKLAGMVRLVEGLETELSGCESALESAEKEGRQLAESLVTSGEEIGRVRSEEAALTGRRDGLAGQVARMRESADEIRSRIEENRRAAEAARKRKADLEEESKQSAGRLGELHTRRGAVSESLEDSGRRVTEKRDAIGRVETEARAVRERLDEARARRQAAEVDAARLASDREHVGERCREELGQSVEQAEAQLSETAGESDEPQAPFDAEACEAGMAELRGKLSSIGPVNMMALDQFAELEERYTFLTAQREDLVSSIESLRESIRKINRTSREKFVTAFEEIRRNFNEVYRLLFGGGRAELSLEEEADPLEAGLEIIAQPPGKRLQGISLLSGGEKAMTAIALLFAIFRYQPSPFCLLDEVDAPLDEVNVGRFTRMLREYARETQFIVVTHNTRSMEAADVLYGVTMPEAGVSRVVSVRLPEAVAAAS